MAKGFVLYGGQGTGAVAVEAALTLAGQAYELVDVPDARTLARLLPQMRQVPLLVTPDGEELTESAAILMWLAETLPDDGEWEEGRWRERRGERICARGVAFPRHAAAACPALCCL